MRANSPTFSNARATSGEPARLSLMCVRRGQAGKRLNIDVRGVFRLLKAGARFPDECLFVANGNVVRPLFNDTSVLHISQDGPGLFSIDSNLRGEEIRGEWKLGEARPMTVGHEPSGGALFRSMKLAATYRNDDVAHEQEIVAGEDGAHKRKLR